MKRILLIILSILLITGCTKESKQEETIIPTLNASKSVFEYGTLIKISDIFDYEDIINDNKYLDTSSLGKKEVNIKYKVNNEIKTISYSYYVTDTTKPLIWVEDTLEIEQGDTSNIADKVICTDNYDKKPNCYVEGIYDVNRPGTYIVTFKGIDSNGNTESTKVSLVVKEKEDNTSVVTTPENNVPQVTNPTYVETTDDVILISDVIKEYKNDNTMIGIDVSMWQGNIDWAKVKSSGVEFAMIRLGYQFGFNTNEMELDEYYIQNIEGALANGIKVGVYFYSFATTPEEGKLQANFVLNNIKNYNISMPIAYDWENFKYWNSMNISLYDLRSASYAFQDTIANEGYVPTQYGSKNYLNNFWGTSKYNTWLAHYLPLGYTSDYEGSYNMWQLTNTGRVDGINGDVDIDVYYK